MVAFELFRTPKTPSPVVPFPTGGVDIPFGCEIAELVSWFRKMTRAAQQQGGDRRSMVDGIKPFIQELWQSLTVPALRRFLRHARCSPPSNGAAGGRIHRERNVIRPRVATFTQYRRRSSPTARRSGPGSRPSRIRGISISGNRLSRSTRTGPADGSRGRARPFGRPRRWSSS